MPGLGGRRHVFGVLTATLGVSLLSISLLSLWQHNLLMNEAMRGLPNIQLHETMMLWMSLPTAAASAALIAISITYILTQLRGAKTGLVGLTERESAVVKYLTSHGGVAEQREIAKALGLTRLQAHRVVSSLRSRNIVEVEPLGRTNLVRLRIDNLGQDVKQTA
ncbi:MAG: hypothetical protein RMJ28_03895 [Nitrososphaerota archaeon]|nr:hypothetical protein [Nitrososphaerota archaeon]